jgi:hypothetical protein
MVVDAKLNLSVFAVKEDHELNSEDSITAAAGIGISLDRVPC